MTAIVSPPQTSLQFVRHYPFSREKLFRAWTEPQALKQWFGPSDSHLILIAETDLRVGGPWRVVMQTPDGRRHAIGGAYREISPPARLVLTWVNESKPEDESILTIDLRDSAGGAELTLTHERFIGDEARAMFARGWAGSLDRLQRVQVS
jgi:uncharacterized protein YndB with AHSA1/START domain